MHGVYKQATIFAAEKFGSVNIRHNISTFNEFINNFFFFFTFNLIVKLISLSDIHIFNVKLAAIY